MPRAAEKRMLQGMGWEAANLHLGTPAVVKNVLADLKSRKKDWLKKAAEKMTDATLKDWGKWREKSNRS